MREKTPLSQQKSALIKELRLRGDFLGKVIHIGDGLNDLEVWQNDAVDLFIGFGLHHIVPEVKEQAPVFVSSFIEFEQAIADVLMS